MVFEEQYSDDQLLSVLRRVASVTSGALTMAVFDSLSEMRAGTVRRRFGTWREALETAGVVERTAPRRVTTKMRAQRSRVMTDSQILSELRSVAERLGTSSLTHTDVRDHCPTVGTRTLHRRFGSFAAALSAAGLEVHPVETIYSDHELLSNLRYIEDHFSREAVPTDLRRAPSTIRLAAYLHRYGSWAAAMQALRTANEALLFGASGHPNTTRVQARGHPGHLGNSSRTHIW